MSAWTESTAAEIEAACLSALTTLNAPAMRATVHTMVIKAGVNVSGSARIGSTLKNLAKRGKVVQTGLWYQIAQVEADEFDNIEWVPSTEPEAIPRGAGASLRRLFPSIRG